MLWKHRRVSGFHVLGLAGEWKLGRKNGLMGEFIHSSRKWSAIADPECVAKCSKLIIYGLIFIS